MKFSVLPFLIIFLLFYSTSNSISAVSAVQGYDVVHTRVVEGSFEISSFEDSSYFNRQGTKVNYTIELWNPSSQSITFTYESRGSCGFEVTFNDTSLPFALNCGIFANDPTLLLSPGITTINVAFERVYGEFDPNKINFEIQDGIYDIELKLRSSQNSSYPFGQSYTSTIEFLNNESMGFDSYLPDNWGIMDDNLPVVISTAIVQAEFRFIPIQSRQSVSLRFIGEYWNPTNEVVYTGSSSDCYDRLGFNKVMSYSNDIFVDDGPFACHDTVMQYPAEPGINQWTETFMSFDLFNWNNNSLPDGKYYFYFTLFQNPINIHKSILQVRNNQMEFDYVSPPSWGEQEEITSSYIDPSTIQDSSTEQDSETELSSELPLFTLQIMGPSLFLMVVIKYFIHKKIY